MRTETTYYAIDETEFDNEQDCLEYERGLTKLSGSVQWFTEDRALMKEPDFQDVESIAMYFRVVDSEAAAEDTLNGLVRYVSEKQKAVGLSEINILMNRRTGTTAPTAGLT